MPARSGVARFKLVISATRDGVQLHPSVEAIPEGRQREAREALDGELAATLLIADKAGLSRMKRLMASAGGAKQSSPAPMGVARQAGLGFLACGLILLACLLWAWFR